MKTARCAHGRENCPSCAAFLASVKDAVRAVKPGDQPWTKTFGALNAQAGRAK